MIDPLALAATPVLTAPVTPTSPTPNPKPELSTSLPHENPTPPKAGQELESISNPQLDTPCTPKPGPI